MELLNKLLNIHSVSGDERLMTDFLIEYVNQRKSQWKVQPEFYFGGEFHDCLLLKFGTPKTAVFSHIDTIGFTVRYEDQLVSIGGPEVENGFDLVGEDALGPIKCRLVEIDGDLFHDFPRAIVRGTLLSFAQVIRINGGFIQAAYLDNRLGIYNCLKLCESLENGWVVFSTYEEHGGGSVPFLLKFIQETSPIKQALVSDITWITEGISHHQGVVISMRDQFIPRKIYLNRIIKLALESGIPFQLEVEGSGGSDGREIQHSPYAIDWCFIGAAEDNVHTPSEKVSLLDLDSMLALYRYLMKHL
ncbi:aminopeptidase [Aquiflexum sp.]|uniref:aminopeptidase n=1 Tax=Aquiflexum sp. TaxID=1872584 RepID=UPI003593B8DD